MNKEYILNKVKPSLDSDGRLAEDDFNNMSNEQICIIYQQGGRQALDFLVGNNINLVRSRAKKFCIRFKHKLDEEDLVQYGVIGLITAAKKFDLKKKVKFSTYATYWIDQRILRSIFDCGFTVRLPNYYFEKVSKVLRIIRQNPEADKQLLLKLAKEDGMSKQKFEEIRTVIDNMLSLISLNTAVGEGKDTEIGDLAVDDISPTTEQQVEHNMLKESIEVALSTLKGREREVIELRFGLNGNIPRTLEQIGAEYNVTRERVRQIEEKALSKLRDPIRSRRLKDFFEI